MAYFFRKSIDLGHFINDQTALDRSVPIEYKLQLIHETLFEEAFKILMRDHPLQIGKAQAVTLALTEKRDHEDVLWELTVGVFE